MPKPSKRIYQLIGNVRSDPEWEERIVDAIIEYLDEEYEKKQKGQNESN